MAEFRLWPMLQEKQVLIFNKKACKFKHKKRLYSFKEALFKMIAT